MRPHKLAFSGIGSYPGEVVVDFDELSAKGLYLIVGPTGAGKTTLLDAITFALYGKVAQSRENAIVSNHAHRKSPSIEFEFSQGGRRYRIRREPALPGKNVNTNKQTMREIGPGGDEIRTVTGVRPINEWAKEIVGLSAEEFMQVILLPQGKFQQFLMAQGADKQKLLQNIFGTGVYRRIAERLMSSSKLLEDEVTADREALGNEWAIVGSSLDTLRNHPEFGDLSGDEVVTSLVELDVTVDHVETKSTELDAAESTSRGRHAQLTSEHDQAVGEVKRFDQALELEDLRRAHSADSASIEAARTRVSEHRRAEPVLTTAATRDGLVRQLSDLDGVVSSTRRGIEQRLGKMSVAPKLLEPLSTAVPTASPTALSTEFSKCQGRLTEASAAFADLDVLASRVAENTADSARLAKEITASEKKLAAAQAAEKTIKSTLRAARDKVKGLNAARKAVEELDTHLEKADVEVATTNLEHASSVLERAQTKFDKAEKALRQAQAQRTRELAGVLASELAKGDECPVCGSTEHPRKAKKSSASSDVEVAEANRDRENTALVEARGAVTTAQKALDEAKKFRSTLPTAAAQKKIRKDLADLEGLVESIEELDESLEEATAEVGRLRESITESKRDADRVAADAKNLQSNRDRLEKITTGIGSARAVQAALDVCREVASLLDDLDKQVRESTKLQGAVNETTESADRSLRDSGFVSEDEARRQFLDDPVRRELSAAIEAHDERDRAIERLNSAVGDRPLPVKRPDLVELAEQLKLAERQAKDAADVAGTVRTALSQIRRAREVIRRIGPEIESKAERAARVRSVAFVFDRGNGGAEGLLSLEVWVQRTLFEEVCLVANEQLLSLSSNRYSLTLDPEEGGITKRRGSGLDIYVRDSHTGSTRPVQTMSGGEQFMASLALALALAEVVQRQAGGIELPCLFIDEGFGGLDLDSLDLAIDVLTRIQAAGRTVGIITHVEAMQQQLPIGIRVHKSDTGSTLEVLTN